MHRFFILLAMIAVIALSGPSIVQWAVEALPRDEAEATVEKQPTTRRGGRGTVILTAGTNGHFVTTARINNRLVDVLVDTGASSVVLPYEDAVRLGLRPGNSDYVVEARTANGKRNFAPVTLREVRIDNLRVYDVPALVGPRGAVTTTLLGMTFLSRLKQVQMSAGELVMQQ